MAYFNLFFDDVKHQNTQLDAKQTHEDIAKNKLAILNVTSLKEKGVKSNEGKNGKLYNKLDSNLVSSVCTEKYLLSGFPPQTSLLH